MIDSQMQRSLNSVADRIDDVLIKPELTPEVRNELSNISYKLKKIIASR